MIKDDYFHEEFYLSIFSFRSLQRTLDDLRDYQEKHEVYQLEQQKLESEQASDDNKKLAQTGYERIKILSNTLDNSTCTIFNVLYGALRTSAYLLEFFMNIIFSPYTTST